MRNSFLFISFFSFLSMTVAGQTGKINGIWEGRLSVGVELRIVFHIADDGKGGLKSTVDSPDQSAYGIKCDTTFLAGDSLHIQMKSMMANFTGKLSGTTIKGNFVQRATLPLTLQKVEAASVRNRPQTPKPPFPYKTEDIIYNNTNKSLKYGATITIPAGTGPFPAAVLITGSGAQDRNETILGHQSFAVIADYLTLNGFIVLRVDDRGVGKSTGLFSEATSADFATDVNTSVDYLLSRPEVDKSKVGLIGHSEGGMIAPIVATERNDINFIILLAGPGVKITDLMAEQAAAVMRSSGINEKATTTYKLLYKEVAAITVAATDTNSAFTNAKAAAEQWASTTNKSILKDLGMKEQDNRSTFVISLVRVMSTKWFKYFLQFDPQVYLEKLTCKVLALNGDKDIQVIAKQNLDGIKTSLKKSKATAVEINELPGLNHLFQSCKKCTVQEYGELEESFSPTALTMMKEWLTKNVK